MDRTAMLPQSSRLLGYHAQLWQAVKVVDRKSDNSLDAWWTAAYYY
jgi:hypothetical protein